MILKMNSATKLIYEFDDLMRCYNVLLDGSCEYDFLRYINNQEELKLKWVELKNENKRLKMSLDAANKDISVLDSKLTSARKWLDSERQQRKKAENERDSLANVFEEIRRILLNDPRYKLPDDTRERLSSLSKTIYESNNGYRTPYDRLNTITELDSTTSNLSDVSISRSEDDLDETNTCARRKHRPSFLDEEPVTIKKRKSVTLTFTPSAPRAESVDSLESAGMENDKKEHRQTAHTPAIERLNARTHSFVNTNVIMTGCCLPCEKRIRFQSALRCTDCNAIAHPECRDRVPLPCIPMGTPSKSGVMGFVSDYAPLVPPMIPAIIIHCINEVEQRGLKEVGIYRIPGNDRDVRSLKEKFLRCKGAPCLSEVDIYTVCCCLKNFLRSLKDSLIPQSKWNDFAKAIFEADKTENLYQLISTLPQANRDTLAFLILHLQRVAASPESKMSIPALAITFGPTVVCRACTQQEVETVNTIMQELLLLPAEYWSHFIVEPPTFPKTPCTLRNTPSTESLMRKTSRKFLTTPGSRKRFFNTPPTKRDSDS